MTDSTGSEPLAAPVDRALRLGENLAYALAGVVLWAGALAVLLSVAYHLAVDLADGVVPTVTDALDGLLLVFILLELLAAIRATITERALVAEPFLIAGIIASIKEILVVAIEAKDKSGADFEHAMIEMGVLGGLVLLLAVATYLVRRKEREPEEGDAA
jgi:uncharacterized membrane protein (DUF373 family)